ncbi:response regulator [Gracilimonas sediminicola]|uniref:Response regulator n=1 Tax=Gracilimonas sediminicola TaxID=2952158 RepID=A0A9X2L5I7_9BACT|nr:response regulator [Gracilimonas sediminicola]MCP9292744.1 response regulator [Gracilimonas sediminicola]
MKIIIVEDDKVLSLLLSKMIERLNYEVIEIITKGHEAIEKIDALNPDLVLMDIMLEDDVDGIDAMTALREKANDVPVIYITGNSDPLNRERAKTTDFIDYLIKPVSFDELKSTINRLAEKES